MGSKIEWTDCTWQVTHGCAKVSPGCANCYAIRDVHRMAGNPNPVISDPRKGKTHRVGDITDWTGVVEPAPQNLAWPLRKKKGKRIFVNSNSDLFHEDIPLRFIAAVYGVMAACPQHTFQVLTKRPARMLYFFDWLQDQDPIGNGVNAAITEMFGYEGPNAILTKGAPDHDEDDLEHISYRLIADPPDWPLSNVWHGVSIENQAIANERLPLLEKVPSALRFVSLEPMLESVALGLERLEVEGGYYTVPDANGVRPTPRSVLIKWVIVGGESGSKARPCNLAWIRRTIRECAAARVPCFVKQLGGKAFTTDDHLDFDSAAALKRGSSAHIWRNGQLERVTHGGTAETFEAAYDWPTKHSKGGDPAEWPEDLRVRQLPERIGHGSH